MDLQPDWKSKLLVALFGKKRLMTLLDTSQLMFRQDFKKTNTYSTISTQIIYSLVGANTLALITSFILSKTVFRQPKMFSLPKLLSDCAIVFSSYYIAAIYLSTSIKQEVHSSKADYFKHFDTDFLFHFNFLAAKYEIDEELQTENIFNRQQLAQWINKSVLKASQNQEI